MKKKEKQREGRREKNTGQEEERKIEAGKKKEKQRQGRRKKYTRREEERKVEAMKKTDAVKYVL